MIEGGCLCGSVRYAITEPALQTCLCHCEDCRRASGAHAVAWTFFATGSLQWTRGKPKMIRFAERERFFCEDCGTPLMFFDPAIPHLFEVTTCSLDQPDLFPPQDQCWVADAVAWAKEIHALPSYDQYSPLPVIDFPAPPAD
ncbi:MAG: GFA family protein [Verrucomicrobia bacterium]|nr:MAG: GFA family protein [Verrucomicrobiota bacterium]